MSRITDIRRNPEVIAYHRSPKKFKSIRLNDTHSGYGAFFSSKPHKFKGKYVYQVKLDLTNGISYVEEPPADIARDISDEIGIDISGLTVGDLVRPTVEEYLALGAPPGAHEPGLLRQYMSKESVAEFFLRRGINYFWDETLGGGYIEYMVFDPESISIIKRRNTFQHPELNQGVWRPRRLRRRNPARYRYYRRNKYDEDESYQVTNRLFDRLSYKDTAPFKHYGSAGRPPTEIQTDRDFKKEWNKEADQKFFQQNVTKIHWIGGFGGKQITGCKNKPQPCLLNILKSWIKTKNTKNELSVVGHHETTPANTTVLGVIGIIVDGYVSYASKEDAATEWSSYATDTDIKHHSGSGLPKRAMIKTPMYGAQDFIEPHTAHNELIVDNWKIDGVILDTDFSRPFSYWSILKPKRQLRTEKLQKLQKQKAQEFKDIIKYLHAKGLKIYDTNLKELQIKPGRHPRRRYRRNPAKCPNCDGIEPDSEIGKKCFWCNYRKELPAPILYEQYDFTPLPMYEVPEACDCEICRSMCKRPCWPTPQDAERLMDLGYGDRLMIDYWDADESLDYTEVLVPAFHGLEKDYAPSSMVALARYEQEAGCNFLTDEGLCEIHSICKPTEGRLASCKGTPRELHLQVAQTWDTPEAKALVERWKKEYRQNPMTPDGWVQAFAEIYTSDGIPVWKWELGQLENVIAPDIQTKEEIRALLDTAINQAVVSGVSSPGDKLVITIGNDVVEIDL